MALGIFLQPERVLIGGIGMHHWNQDQKRAQIGYWIAKDFAGRGLMSRSAERFVDFLFRKVGLNKVEIHSLPHNKRSLDLANRLGAKFEGRIRQSYLASSGQLEDTVITGILRSE
jgi:ribosomal-protein-serine acetyltransferase